MIAASFDTMGYLGAITGVLALDGLMIVCFGVAIFLALRRPGSVAALCCAMGPFALGSAALWVGGQIIFSILAGLERGEGLPVVVIFQVVNLPFYLGIVLSVISLVMFFKKRRGGQ